jgi:hypothetical protein
LASNELITFAKVKLRRYALVAADATETMDKTDMLDQMAKMVTRDHGGLFFISSCAGVGDLVGGGAARSAGV